MPISQAAVHCWFVTLLLLLSAGSVPLAPERPVQITKGPVGELGPAVSPDGRWMAIEYFTREHPNDPEIWVMPSTAAFSEAKPILHDSNKVYGEIAWSPDSNWMSFVSSPRYQAEPEAKQVFKVNITTRQIIQLTHLDRAVTGGGTSWSSDGRIAFALKEGIYVVPEAGGAATRLLDVRGKLGAIEPDFPIWSPDSSHLAFVGTASDFVDFSSESHGRDLYLADIQTGEISKLFSDVEGSCPSWFDGTHILVSHQDSPVRASLWLVPIGGGKAARLTEGYYDIAPVTSRTRKYLYFARNEGDASMIHRSWQDSEYIRGFHIWRRKVDFAQSLGSHSRH